jgi:hypothetical protein
LVLGVADVRHPGITDRCGSARATPATFVLPTSRHWQLERAAVSQVSPVKAQRARDSSAIVRKLLRQRQPEFAAALASAEHYFSCPWAERGDGIDVMIAHKIYHLDGTVCHEAASCFGWEHTRLPPRCATEPLAEIAGRAVTCDLPRGHPGPHLHVETGWQY